MIRSTGEVDDGAARGLVDGDMDDDLCAVVEGVLEMAMVGQGFQDPAHGGLGVVLDMTHVGMDDVGAVVVDHALEFSDAFCIGGDLGLEVGDVLVGVAGGVMGTPLRGFGYPTFFAIFFAALRRVDNLRASTVLFVDARSDPPYVKRLVLVHTRALGVAPFQQLAYLFLAKPSLVDQNKIVDQYAFFMNGTAPGRHGAGGDATDVGVVAAGGDEESYGAGGVEDGGDDGDVGEMGAAVVGVVEGEDVAGAEGVLAAAQYGAHGVAHGAEVDGDMGGVGDEMALAVEEGAGEVEALLDVDGIGGVDEGGAHLFGDGHEEVVEYFEHDGVGAGADGRGAPRGFGAGEQEIPLVGDLGPPFGFDDGGGVGFDEESGAGDAGAGGEGLALVDGGGECPAAGVEIDVGDGRRILSTNQRVIPTGGRDLVGLDGGWAEDFSL